jgi:hypothetical protein
VRLPRVRIAWVMFAVAIAALDFAAIREWSHSVRGDFLVVGALPMANVLAVAMLVTRRRPGSRPFVLGFVSFGMLALTVYVALTVLFIDPFGAWTPYRLMIFRYLDLFLGPLNKSAIPFNHVTIAWFGCAVMLGWPQLAFALFGGYVSRRFKGTITRR